MPIHVVYFPDTVGAVNQRDKMDLQVKLNRDLDAAIQRRVSARMRGRPYASLRLERVVTEWIEQTKEVEDDGPRLEQPARRRVRR